MTARVDFRPKPYRPPAPLVRASDVEPCHVCGDRIGPWYGREGLRWCVRCAPAEMKERRGGR